MRGQHSSSLLSLPCLLGLSRLAEILLLAWPPAPDTNCCQIRAHQGALDTCRSQSEQQEAAAQPGLIDKDLLQHAGFKLRSSNFVLPDIILSQGGRTAAFLFISTVAVLAPDNSPLWVERAQKLKEGFKTSFVLLAGSDPGIMQAACRFCGNPVLMLLPAHGNLTEAAVRVLEALPSPGEVSELASKRQEALQSPMEQLLHTLPDLKSSPAGSVASMAAGAAQLLPCTDISSDGLQKVVNFFEMPIQI